MALFMFIIWGLNIAISFFNARGVGLAWKESKLRGGWMRVMAWAGAVMAASGFSWCLLIFLALAAHGLFPAKFPAWALDASLSLGYVVILPCVLISGVIITVDSWKIARQTRRGRDIAIATYNTLATVSNAAGAVKDLGSAAGSSRDLFKGISSSKDAGALIVILLVAMSFLGGVLITIAIVEHYARRRPVTSVSQAPLNRGLAAT